MNSRDVNGREVNGYALNTGPTGRRHHEIIACLWDQYTKPKITALYTGPDTLRGARVLEIGAGCGTVALWLAAQVAPLTPASPNRRVEHEGHVYALDLDPSIIATHPRLTTIKADLNTDPLPAGPFDFIHARQVLPHVHTRETILRALAQRLTPGGWLLVEDLHHPGDHLVLDAPSPQSGDLIYRVQTAIGQVFAQAGSDRGWAARVPRLMRQARLAHVHTTMHAETWTNGPHSKGAAFLTGLIDQLRPRLLRQGLTDHDLTTVRQALLSDTGTDEGRPELLLKGHTLWSTAGRAPGGPR